jgi:DNA polymerase III delta subunit
MRYSDAVTLLTFKRDTRFALVGSEPFLKEYFIKLSYTIYPGNVVEKYSPDDASEALINLGSESLFSERIIILIDFDKMKPERFTEALNNFAGLLILVCSEKADAKSKTLSKILSDITPVDCYRLREYSDDYIIWISTMVAQEGYTIKDDACRLLYTLIGPNMYSLANELGKLFLVVPSKTITLEDVKKYVSVVSISSLFEIFDCLIRRDVPEALRCLDSYSRINDNYVDLVNFLEISFEKLYRIALLKEDKKDTETIASIVGIPKGIIVTKYLPRMQAMGKAFIGSQIDALCNLEIRLRLFKGDKKVLVAHYFHRFVK